MVKKIPGSNSMLSLLSIAALVAGSLSIGLFNGVEAKEMSYDEALRALQKTKQHSKAAERWGEKRTVPVPKGEDPNQLIKKELLQVPGVEGIKGAVTPKKVNPIKVKVPAGQEAPIPVPVSKTPETKAPQKQAEKKQAGGWDWLSSNDTAKKAPQAPVPQTTQAKPVGSQVPISQQTGMHGVGKSSLQTTYEAPVVEKPAPKKVVTTPAPQKVEELNLTPNTKKAAVPAVVKQPVVNVSRESATELYNRAVKAHLSGKLSEAIADYSSALRKDPKLANAHCNLGQIYNQQHHFDMAIGEFRKALAINSER